MGSHLQNFSMSIMLLLVVFSASLEICQPTSTSTLKKTSNISQIFEDWMTEHNRVYSNSEEKARRLEIFKAKYHYVEKFNKEGEKKTYTIGLNRFSDLTTAEFDKSYKCRRTTEAKVPASINMFNSSSLFPLPRDCGEVPVDWSMVSHRGDGTTIPSPVSPVRNQGDNCGSCWVMSAVAAVEAANRIKWGPDIPLPPLSIQQVLDCAYGDKCGGGSEFDVYAYIMKNRGLASEQGYGYTMTNETCDESRASHVVGGSIVGFALVHPNTELELMRAVCKGPVVASIASNTTEFNDYKGGVFRGPCGDDIDHNVLIVGFGRDENYQQYWKIQNAWGNNWGEEGYMRLSFTAGEDSDACQITKVASYPLLTTDPE